MNSLENGNLPPVPAEEGAPAPKPTRMEKIRAAERSVCKIFAERLEEVLERIGKNPYHSDLENTV